MKKPMLAVGKSRLTYVFRGADVLLICCLICFFYWVYYPGIFSVDSHSQLHQARTGNYNIWHPPVMAYLWSLLIALTNEVSTMMLLHLTMFYTGLLLLLRSWKLPVLLRCLVIGVIAFYPTTLTHQGFVWKDILLASSFLFAAGVLSRISSIESYSKWLWVPIIVCLFLGASARHNGSLVLIPFCFWAASIVTSSGTPFHWKSALFGTLSLLAIGSGSFVANHYLADELEPHPTQIVFMYDLMGISIRNEQIFLPEYLKKQTSLKEIQAGFTTDYIPDLPRKLQTQDLQEIQELREQWIQTILLHPFDYLRVRYAMFEYTIGLGPHSYCIPIHPIDGERDVALPQIHFLFQAFDFAQSLTASVLYRAWLYILICVSGLVIAIWKRSWDSSFFLCASALLNVLSLFPSAHACDFRYLYWTVVVALTVFLGKGLGVIWSILASHSHHLSEKLPEKGTSPRKVPRKVPASFSKKVYRLSLS